jgi:hypothetical protein
MTLPPESERSNLDWLTALRADSDQAWAAIRERVLRAGSFDGGARHLEGCGVQGDLVCSEVFELLPKYVDLILATGDASRSQLGQPAEALPQVAHLSSSARSAPKRTRRCSRSNDPRGKIQRSPASNAWQEAREAVSRRSVSRSDAS